MVTHPPIFCLHSLESYYSLNIKWWFLLNWTSSVNVVLKEDVCNACIIARKCKIQPSLIRALVWHAGFVVIRRHGTILSAWTGRYLHEPEHNLHYVLSRTNSSRWVHARALFARFQYDKYKQTSWWRANILYEEDKHSEGEQRTWKGDGTNSLQGGGTNAHYVFGSRTQISVGGILKFWPNTNMNI